MRIFFASDLHFDARRGRQAVDALADWVNEHGRCEDVLLLGGDYGNDDPTVEACLSRLEGFPGTTLAVAGNHDIWVDTEGDSRERGSRSRWRDLQGLFDDADIHPLEHGPKIVGDTAFCGAMGWYDYSFRVRGLGVGMDVYRQKRLPQYDQPIWKDAFHARWDGRTDPEVTQWQVEQLAGHLEEAADSSARRLVVALHHVPTEQLLSPDWLPDFLPRHYLVPQKWLVLNTYLGSRRFADLCAEYADRVDVVFCGHIHLARDARDGGVRYVSNGSNYEQKELTIWEDGELRRKVF